MERHRSDLTAELLVLCVLTMLLAFLASGCAALKEAARPEVVHSLPASQAYIVVLTSLTGQVVDVFESDTLGPIIFASSCVPRVLPAVYVPSLLCPMRVKRVFLFKELNRVERVAHYEEERVE